MYQLDTNQQDPKTKEATQILNDKNWNELATWLENNDEGGEILLPFLNNPSVQPSKNFVARVLSRLSEEDLKMVKANQELIIKIEEQLNWALFLIRMRKAKIFESEAKLDQAVEQLCLAVNLINETSNEESTRMLDFLSIAIQPYLFLCEIAPLLLGVAAVHADVSGDLEKRKQLLAVAFYLAPYDEELLALAERRSWPVGNSLPTQPVIMPIDSFDTNQGIYL